MRSEVGATVTPRVSLSVMLTAAAAVVPLVTRRGSVVPSANLTRSPSSSMSSSTGVNVIDLLVSPSAKVTVMGREE